jgi:hypothetical protein
MWKYASAFFVLIAASSAQAQSWEWRRQPVTAEDYCEIKRIDKLTPLSKGELDSVMESERTAFNDQSLLQYNRVLPSVLPSIPTPEVGPPARRGILRRFFH